MSQTTSPVLALKGPRMEPQTGTEPPTALSRVRVELHPAPVLRQESLVSGSGNSAPCPACLCMNILNVPGVWPGPRWSLTQISHSL